VRKSQGHLAEFILHRTCSDAGLGDQIIKKEKINSFSK